MTAEADTIVDARTGLCELLDIADKGRRGMLSTSAVLGKGSIVIYDEGRPVGHTTPAGQTGMNAQIIFEWPWAKALRSLLTGFTIEFIWEVTTSATWGRTLDPNLTVRNTSGVAVDTRTSFLVGTRRSILSASRVIRAAYVLQGDEFTIRPYLKQGGADSAVADEFFRVSNFSIRIISPAGSALSVDELAEKIRRHTKLPDLGMGDVLPLTNVSINAQGGSSVYQGNGLFFPAGQTGATASISPRWDFKYYDVTPWIGGILEWRWLFKCSTNFSRMPAVAATIWTGGGLFPSGNTDRRILSTRQGLVGTDQYEVVMQQIVEGDEQIFSPAIRFPAASSISDEWIVPVRLEPRLIRSEVGGLPIETRNHQQAQLNTANQAILQSRADMAGGYYKIVTVRADGTGDFTDLKLALASITDASQFRRYLIRLIGPIDLVYTTAPCDLGKDWVDIAGNGLWHCKVTLSLPDDTPPALLNATSLFTGNVNSKISGISAYAINCRYVIHPDSYRGAVNKRLEVEDVHFEHLGNEGARRISGSVGLNTIAFGSGGASGQEMILRRSTFVGFRIWGLVWHTDPGYVRPSKLRLEYCSVLRSDTTNLYALLLSGAADGDANVVELINCQFNGPVGLQQSSNIQTDPLRMFADRRTIQLTATGLDVPVLMAGGHNFPALRIESTSTGPSSSVVFTGPLMALVMGQTVTDIGGGGLAGATYGLYDVVSQTLGQRIGDRSVTPVSGSVVVDGGAPITVTVSTDVTHASNDDVLCLINDQLGVSATATLMNVADRYRANLPDRQRWVRNTSSDGFPVGVALALVDGDTVRLMTSADPASAWAGVTIERAPPGARVRVQHSGAVNIAQDLLRSDAAAITVGATLGVGSTPGRFEVGAAVPLVRAYSTTDARIIAA